MPQLVCVPCRRFYRCKKNEYIWEEGSPQTEAGGMGLRPKREDFGLDSMYRQKLERWEEQWGAYKLWNSDMWECPGCGHQAISGHARQPMAMHHEEDYEETAASYPPQIRVNDC